MTSAYVREKLQYQFISFTNEKEIRDQIESRIDGDLFCYSVLGLYRYLEVFYVAEPDQYAGSASIWKANKAPADLFKNGVTLGLVMIDFGPSYPSNERAVICIPLPKTPNKERAPTRQNNAILRYIYAHKPLTFDTWRQRHIDKKLRNIGQLVPNKIQRPKIFKVANTDRVGNQKDILSNVPVALIAMHWLDTGGAEACALEAAKFAKSRGYYTIIITDVRGKNSLERQAKTVSDLIINLDRILPSEYYRYFYESIVKAINVEILHIHHSRSAYEALPAIKVYCPEIKVAVSTHIIEYDKGGYCGLTTKYADFIDNIHVISKELIRYFKDYSGICEKKINIGYLSGEQEFIDETELDESKFSDIKKQLKLLFVGRMEQQKRPYIAVQVASLLKKANVNFAMKFIGDGSQLEIAKDLAKRLNLLPQLEFSGNLKHSDVILEMEKSHVLLLPSQNEGLALVCFEATRKNMIVVGTDVGSQSELIFESMLTPRQTHKCVRASTDCILQIVSDSNEYMRVLNGQKKLYNDILRQLNYSSFLESFYDNN